MRRRGNLGIARETMRLRREAAAILGCTAKEVETLTGKLAPQARRGGGTEGDMLVLVHEMAVRSKRRPGDIDYIVDTTLAAVDNGQVRGLHGRPLRDMIAAPEPVIDACYQACAHLWPDAYESWDEKFRIRDLQVRHAQLKASALLLSELEELKSLEREMEAAGVVPDEALIAEASTRDSAESSPSPSRDTTDGHLPRRGS